MKVNNDCDISNLGYLLFMQEQEEKSKTTANDGKCFDLLEIYKTTPYTKNKN